MRSRLDPFMLAALASLLAASGGACGGKAVIDAPTGDAGGGGTGGTSTTSSAGTGGTTVTTTSTTTGPCYSCSDFVLACANGQCPDPALICPGSAQQSYDLLRGCLCLECADVCPLLCSGQPPEGPDCMACQGNAASAACAAEFGTCVSS